MKKVIIVLILLSSPVFASSYNATNFAVMNAVIVSSMVSSNIAIKKNNCALFKKCIKFKGGNACKKYKWRW